jgi:nucleotide-binding universal stress UspA family protein
MPWSRWFLNSSISSNAALSSVPKTVADTYAEFQSRRIVVGVDGSPSSRIALEHAARRVGPGGSLLVAHSVSVLPEAVSRAVVGIDDVRRDIARQLVEQQSAIAGVDATPQVLEGRPAEALAELARQGNAHEIVVGTRGLGRFAAALGSVAHTLVGHADRPVVVVPQGAADRAPGADHQTCIVVGYDGSRAARAAVAYGTRRVYDGGRLVVVHAFPPELDGMKASDYQRVLDAYQVQGRELLGSLEEQTGVDVELVTSVLEGPPAREIVAAADARDADEIVIGSRGFGALRGALGSVSHAVLHEANRPVVVIPADAVPDSARKEGDEQSASS